jgi:hypothetical protein
MMNNGFLKDRERSSKEDLFWLFITDAGERWFR